MPYFEAIWCKSREMSLSIILTTFLFLSNFEPRYSYKQYSNKEKTVYINRHTLTHPHKHKHTYIHILTDRQRHKHKHTHLDPHTETLTHTHTETHTRTQNTYTQRHICKRTIDFLNCFITLKFCLQPASRPLYTCLNAAAHRR